MKKVNFTFKSEALPTRLHYPSSDSPIQPGPADMLQRFESKELQEVQFNPKVIT